jgi:hypothetical protein
MDGPSTSDRQLRLVVLSSANDLRHVTVGPERARLFCMKLNIGKPRARFDTLDYSDVEPGTLLLRQPLLRRVSAHIEWPRVPRLSTLVRSKTERSALVAKARRRLFVALVAVFVIGLTGGALLRSVNLSWLHHTIGGI